MLIEKIQSLFPKSIVYASVSNPDTEIDLAVVYSPDGPEAGNTELLLISAKNFSAKNDLSAKNCLVISPSGKLRGVDNSSIENLYVLKSRKDISFISNMILRAINVDRSSAKDSDPLQKKDYLSETVYHLFTNGTCEPAAVENGLRALGWSESDYYYLFRIVKQDMKSVITLSESTDIQKAITGIYPGSIFIPLRGSLYWLMNRALHQKVFVQTVLKKISSAMKSRNLVISVSFTFFDFTAKSLITAKQQADIALEYGPIYYSDNAYDYRNIMFYDILANCRPALDLRQFIHPTMLKLAKYDYENDTNYVETLQIYLLCNMRVKDTTFYLGIHKNTLFYRLNKISEIIALRLDNYTQVFQYSISIYILDYLKKHGVMLFDDIRYEEEGS